MSASKKTVPVVLTGRVYVHGVLEDGFSHLCTPVKPACGDFRLHSHLDAAGRKRREQGKSQGGYSGVLRASLFDGKEWRVFMLAKEASAESRHFNNGEYRNIRARQVIQLLGRLKGLTCTWRNNAFAVNRGIPPVQNPPAATPKTVTAPASAVAAPATKRLEAETSASAPAASHFRGCGCMQPHFVHVPSPRRRPRRRRKSAPGQLELF